MRRKTGRKRVAWKKGGKTGRKVAKRSYPDVHSFKFMQQDTTIFSAQGNNGGLVGAPITTGAVSLCVPTKNPNGLFSFAGSLQFALGNCPQYSSVASLFDRVRCNKISVRVIPLINAVDAAGPGLIPVMRVVQDYDDNIVPNGPGIVWARRGKNIRLDKSHTFTFVPRVVYGGQNIAGSNQLTLNQKCPLLNCTNASNISLYGLKFGIKDFVGNATNNNKIRFEVTYYMTFKEQLNTGISPNMADYGVSLQSDEVIPCNVIDLSGNIYDNSGNLIYTPDASGNEIPYEPPPVAPA